ncbi:MAG: hypothetical protein CMH38_03050 [Microbacterium sp.]|uniref:replicative helicase loader/inhibitor n=1 Tax=Microbacterium sp. TaxID=51671 RepID=UPI000C38B184|nr:replicative helicase loader/inhibitor [Microbacterium sp.]MAY48899.1 hypothetical protein [Microbacterium sp.]
MTTRADALELLALISARHRRTAPRIDDDDEANFIADQWAEMFNHYQLHQADLIAAVKKRSLTPPDAPEPADIIRWARDIRNDRANRVDPEHRQTALYHPDQLADNQRRLAAITDTIGNPPQ